ncbi:kinase-like domain-containing protein, partial [Amanita rubescens]
DCNEAVKKALNAKSPSESAKSKEYKTYQHKSPIYDGRYDATKPIDTTAPPIQLFHPVFGHFLDDLTNDLCVPPEIAKATIEYMRASSAMYDNEAIRKAALEPHLGRILGNGMGTVMNPDGTWPDGAFSITLTNEICEFAVTLIKEEKNNIGDGGSDPSTQVGLSMARFWAQDQHSGVRNNTCCPTFLLATAGPWFTILGGIFTDKWIVQRLTDFIWVGLDATLKEPHYNRVAHILYSLRRNVEKLRDYYIGLKVSVSDTEDLHPRFFPSICTYRDAEDRIIDFKYIKPLEFDSTCVTFLARTTSSTPKDVVVKFVHRYGEEAHRLLAGESLAPQLFYHGKIGVLEGDPSYGHLRMVVMEYIDGETLDQAEQILPTFMDQIRRALDVLHDHNYVFGDLRGPNILITKNEEVKLIDFDWAGVHKQSQYPLLISPNLKWPTGVEGLTIMKTEHDDIMLARLHELYLGKV